MEVKYINLKVEKSGYAPSGYGNRNPRKRPRRNRNYYNSYNRRKSARPHYGLVLVVAIIVMLAGVTVWNVFTPKLSPVENLKALNVTQNGVALKWKKVSDADGYIIYKKAVDEKDFKKVTAVKKTNKYTVKNLNPQTDYTLCVTAVKDHSSLESEKRAVDIFTLPKAPSFTECNSNKEGTLSLKWKSVKNAKKYKIQYTEGTDKNFKNAKTKTVKPSKNPELVLTNLDKAEAYGVRIRVIIKHGETTAKSHWSDANITYIKENFVLRSDIDPNKPMVALTFDDGPGYNGASDKILDVLEKYNAKATFFMVGKNAADHPENIKRKVSLGMELANHSWNHVHYGKNVTTSDISKASNAIYKICGQYPTAFRSPGGMTTDLIREECKRENMPLYYWSIDTQDWLSKDASKVYNSVINNVEDGDIILMHEIYNSTADAVKKIVPKLIKKGYQLVTCRELMYAKRGEAPVPGVQYVSAK